MNVLYFDVNELPLKAHSIYTLEPLGDFDKARHETRTE